MTVEQDNSARRDVTDHSGLDFFTRRVFQRWTRGEISTGAAAQLLRPARAGLSRKGVRPPTQVSPSYDATFAIDPAHVAADTTVGTVALHLVPLGGLIVFWRANEKSRPAIARFEFSTEHEREQFVADALTIPGVSLATRQ
jgi:hypothetical protein